MKYYKAMNKDMSCRGFQYEVGGIYELPKDVKLELCQNGFHFCDILSSCFNYYIKSKCIICEVEPLGKVIHDEYTNKLVTDKIKIVRQLSDEEIEEQRYVIQDGVTIIGDWCFYDCTNLKEINIPNSITYIGTYAFYNCISLKSISIPNAFTYIGDSAFYNCKNLKKIYVPKDFDVNVFNTCMIDKNIKLLDKIEIVRIEK